MKRIAIFSIAALLLTACYKNDKNPAAKQTVSLKNFYYSIDPQNEDGIVYEYHVDSSNIIANYWLIKTVKDEAGDLFIISSGYNALLEQTSFIREWVVADGTILKDYQFIQTDSSSGKSIATAAKIEDNVYFPFKPTLDTGKVYRVRLKATLPTDTALNYDIVRDRRFDKFLDFEFEGKKLKAVQLIVKEYYNAFDRINGGDFHINSEIKEIYAEGIGLVYIEKRGQGANYTYKLKRRISPDEFIKNAK